ncbi:hypothetical protein Acsp04_04980 [Actinomadura sp. NBRC 104425]|uniref:hypothetical protein n=1 Tax=Actinomadura sp. NBRC 104425 TaxID=3032204 RepID=UPI0024A4CB17|nr:hypothetical protein [Actinomadura sp. NBRC 104425]GLZ10263.1 hypothetical protein Acsp04_04980 [Actinomadura sp. NBRC 104425]
MTVLGTRSDPCEPDEALLAVLRDLGLPVDQAHGERLAFTVAETDADGAPLAVRDVSFAVVTNCPLRSKERGRDG